MKARLMVKLSIISLLMGSIVLLVSCEKDESPEPLSPEPVNGVSAAYVSLNEANVSIDQYTLQGRLTLTAQNEIPDIRKGSIITVDLDTMGYLRRVVSVKTEGSKMIMETTQAYLNDVFVDKSFKLNTALIDPDQIVSLKSYDNPGNLSMIGKDGYIHPSEVILYGENGEKTIISASELKSAYADTITLVYFHEDFSGKDLYGKEGDNIHFFISEGYAELGSNAIFEFDFNSNGEYDEDTQVERGDLFYFTFYLNSKADFQTKLELDAAGATNKEGKQNLLKLKRITAKFIVGGVPVWISFDVSVWGAYIFNAAASLHADWGFETKNKLKIGGKYDSATKTLSPISDFESQKTIYPLNVDAELNIDARLEIYPRVDALFYGFLGPFAEIVPFVEGNFNAALHTKITQGGSETFIAWNSGIDLGLDLRIGVKLDFIGKTFDEEFGPTEVNCFNEPLWYSPASIDLLSTIQTESQSNTAIPLSLVVKDNLGNGVSACPVCFNGDGSFSKEIVLSDQQGSASINWVLSDNTSGLKEFSAAIFNATGEIIEEVKGQTNLASTSSDIIFNPNLTYGTVTDIDGNTYRTIQIGTQTWMAENLKTTRYRNGTKIPLVADPTEWANLTSPGYCWYDNNEVYKDTYGALYNFYTIETDHMCPTGWHVPISGEWITLLDYLVNHGYNYDDTYTGNKIAKSLASTYEWNSSTFIGAVGNTDFPDKVNATGFSALPGGFRYREGNFGYLGYFSQWFAANEPIVYTPYYWALGYNGIGLNNVNANLWKFGMSVRCVKD